VDDEREGEQDQDDEENGDVDVSSIIIKIV
jgi:hypothetical protein